jgi:transcriptional regulator with XRE-family HTH domain
MQNRLKVRRTELGLTQLQAAQQSSIHVTRLSHIETGKLDPTADEIDNLAIALKTSPQVIFPGLAEAAEQVQ